MPFGRVFVIVYSVILLILFSTFSFLMTTVNPPKLKKYQTSTSGATTTTTTTTTSSTISTSETETTHSTSEHHKRLRVPPEAFFDELPSLIERKYGIKHADIINDILAQMNRTTQLFKLVDRDGTPASTNLQSIATSEKATEKATPSSQTQKESTKYQLVVPPQWPVITTPAPISSETPSQVKGFRRSVTGTENESDRDYDSENEAVIFKFVNDKGEPVIEIKLGANGALKRFTRKNRSPDVWVEETDNKTIGKNLIPTVIRFAPDNYSVVFENNEEQTENSDESEVPSDNFPAIDLDVQRDDFFDNNGLPYDSIENVTSGLEESSPMINEVGLGNDTNTETRDANVIQFLDNKVVYPTTTMLTKRLVNSTLV